MAESTSRFTSADCAPGLPAGLDGADDRRLERRLVLLEIEGDLLVGHAAHQRAHEEQADEREQRDRQQHAER